jgi:hypothetical protein
MRIPLPAAALIVLLLPGCLGTTEPTQQDLEGKAVFFVGNSLTYYNDMPFMIAAFAEAEGQERLVIGSLLIPDYSLEDLWRDGRAQDQLLQGGWDVVVLQQGPSSTIENQAHLQEWSGRWADLANSVGARPALYMVWPESSRQEAFDDVSQSYRDAAAAADALLFPVGEAWRAAWRMDPSAPLYGPDGFHPSIEGSYLAALVMYQQLYDRSPVGLPNSIELPIGPVTIDPDLALTLQQAAAEANAEYARK